MSVRRRIGEIMARRGKLTDEMRQVLSVLASCPDGATLPLLLRTHACSPHAIGQCLDCEYARERRELVRSSDIMRLWITEAGQKALAAAG
jgi:hypothetical protein